MKQQNTFLNALKWAYAANWGERTFSSLFSFLLATLLGPREFGLVAIALIYVTFIQMLLDQGFVAALIQQNELDPDHLDSVFWLNLSLSAVLVALSILLSHWWATVNHLPSLSHVILALSLCIPIEGLALVQIALLKREMDFKSLSLRSNTAVVLSGLVGLVLALRGFGVWALVGQQLTRDITGLFLLWRFSPWRPRLRFSARHLRELMDFSIMNFTAQLGIFAETQSGAILLGVLFGPIAVGLYRLADKLMSTVLALTQSSIQLVSFPEFARLQSRPEELRRSVLKCIRWSSTITIPPLAGLAVTSDLVVSVIGPQWLAASGVLKLLCVLGMVLIFAFFTGPLLQGLGKSRSVAALEWARTGASLGCLLIAAVIVRGGDLHRQLIGITLARFLTGTCLVTPAFVYILLRSCNISVRKFVSTVTPSLIASSALVVAVLIVRTFDWTSNAKPIVALGVETVVGGLTAIFVLLATDPTLRQILTSIFERPTLSEVRGMN